MAIFGLCHDVAGFVRCNHRFRRPCRDFQPYRNCPRISRLIDGAAAKACNEMQSSRRTILHAVRAIQAVIDMSCHLPAHPRQHAQRYGGLASIKNVARQLG